MPEQQVGLTPWEEHGFWLEIIQDHAYFLRDHLSPVEKSWVAAAEQYIAGFAYLREQLQQLPHKASATDPELVRFSMEAWRISEGYYRLESQVQQLRIRNAILVNLSPTYFNGTLLENREYLRMLTFYRQGQTPPELPLIPLLELWMEDQMGHALLLKNLLDPIEGGTIQKADEFARIFQLFLAQTHQLKAYFLSSSSAAPRLQLLAREVGQAVIGLNQLIIEVTSRFLKHEVLTRTTLRFLEHHFPESCYFLKKLSAYSPILLETAAACSLHKPSFQ